MFKGSQFHKGGQVEPTFDGVVVPGYNGGMEFQLGLPTEQKSAAHALHNKLANMFGVDQSL